MSALRNRHLSLVAAFHQDPLAENLTASSPLATDDFNVPVALFRKRCGGEFDRQPLGSSAVPLLHRGAVLLEPAGQRRELRRRVARATTNAMRFLWHTHEDRLDTAH